MNKTTSTRTTTIPVSVLAALTLALGPLSAQDPEVLPIRDRQHQHPPTGSMGMLMDESGGWREATVEEAFALLRLAPDPQLEMLVGAESVTTPARVTIRQVHRDLPGSVLDGLIRDLKETVLDFSAPEEVRGKAISVLAAAAKDSRFSSYGKQAPGAFEALVQIYEGLGDQTLADAEGDDPVQEAKGRVGGTMVRILHDIFWAEPTGRGKDYVMDLYSRHDPGPIPEGTDRWEYRSGTWCAASRLLHSKPFGHYLPPLPGSPPPWESTYEPPNPDPERHTKWCRRSSG